jgi:hypothetical protein
LTAFYEKLTNAAGLCEEISAAVFEELFGKLAKRTGKLPVLPKR